MNNSVNNVENKKSSFNMQIALHNMNLKERYFKTSRKLFNSGSKVLDQFKSDSLKDHIKSYSYSIIKNLLNFSLRHHSRELLGAYDLLRYANKLFGEDSVLTKLYHPFTNKIYACWLINEEDLFKEERLYRYDRFIDHAHVPNLYILTNCNKPCVDQMKKKLGKLYYMDREDLVKEAMLYEHKICLKDMKINISEGKTVNFEFYWSLNGNFVDSDISKDISQNIKDKYKISEDFKVSISVDFNIVKDIEEQLPVKQDVSSYRDSSTQDKLGFIIDIKEVVLDQTTINGSCEADSTLSELGVKSDNNVGANL